MDNKFKVKIPNGYLMVEEKGVEDEYPGVFIINMRNTPTSKRKRRWGMKAYHTY